MQLIIMVFATFGVMAYRITVSLVLIRDSEDEIVQKNIPMIASITGSMISATFIIIFKLTYVKIANWLTDMENHRTQYHYDNSYIYKSYALAFTNNYSAVFYIAFFKGKFYTHPGDMSLWSAFGGLGSDICDPSGCVLDLAVQLLSIMVMKIVVDNIVQVLVPILKEYVKRKFHKVKDKKALPLYARAYLMPHLDRYYLLDEYMDMVIQYGFIIFFVSAFPLAPFLALVNNFIEVRVDAHKMTKSFQEAAAQENNGAGSLVRHPTRHHLRGSRHKRMFLRQTDGVVEVQTKKTRTKETELVRYHVLISVRFQKAL
ncbi:hypothetical protein NQ318_002861 [Aromia moschata]|uniref:Anoctamin n=1 Tax=Aromia moschata TaxID=1265417 RepID=A0AAV8X302_9CUCU|nr:hypothetical protein NQ318_002861 [Aromia moschata]